MLPELDNLIQILFGWLGMSEWLLFNANSAISAILWREQVNFQVRFVLDQHV
jgi:hypothetical protein